MLIYCLSLYMYYLEPSYFIPKVYAQCRLETATEIQAISADKIASRNLSSNQTPYVAAQTIEEVKRMYYFFC